MLKVVNNKFVIFIMFIVGYLMLFAVPYLEYVLNQQYILEQFQIIYENKDDVGTESGVYDIDGTDFYVGINCEDVLVNGIVLNEEQFTIYINGTATTESYADFDIQNYSDLYNNYLVFRFSSYMTPTIISYFIVNSFLSYILLGGVLYLASKIYEHSNYRSGYFDTMRFFSWKEKIKMCIISSFFAILIYSYGSFFVKNGIFLLIMGSLVALLLQLYQMKNYKKRG